MAAEHERPRAVRLFVALDIPDRVRAGIAAWGARELRDPALRPVRKQNLHLTLCFLGRTERSQVQAAEKAVLGLATRPVRISLDRRPVGKPARRPGIWALEAVSPAAERLQARLAGTLAAAELFEPDDRPFWAHLTVARTRTEPGKRRPRPVEKPPGELPPDLLEPFDAVRVALYRSDLRSDGAKYVSLANLNLPPSAKQPGRTKKVRNRDG